MDYSPNVSNDLLDDSDDGLFTARKRFVRTLCVDALKHTAEGEDCREVFYDPLYVAMFEAADIDVDRIRTKLDDLFGERIINPDFGK